MHWLEGATALAVVTWLGTIIAVIALAYTWFLARSARAASEIAKTAADTAVAAARTKTSVGNLGFSHSVIASLRGSFLESGGLPSAHANYDMLARIVEEAFLLLQVRGDLRGQIRTTRRNLRIVRTQIDLGLTGGSGFSSYIALRALSGIATFLYYGEQELKR